MKDIRDKALAMQAYARQAKDLELVRLATEVRVRAERRAGEMLRETAEAGARQTQQKGGSTVFSGGHTVPGLKDLGVTRKQSSSWQRLAAVPEPEFERGLTSVDLGAVSTRRCVHARGLSPWSATIGRCPRMSLVDALEATTTPAARRGRAG